MFALNLSVSKWKHAYKLFDFSISHFIFDQFLEFIFFAEFILIDQWSDRSIWFYFSILFQVSRVNGQNLNIFVSLNARLDSVEKNY